AKATAAGASITPFTNVPGAFGYQITEPGPNQTTGSPNTAANIPAGAAQSFVFAITPTDRVAPPDVQFAFACATRPPAPIIPGVNTLAFTASSTPVPDVVVLAATSTNDGILNVPGTTGAAAFAVATANVGAHGSIVASADTGSATLPLSLSLCPAGPATGQCIPAVGSTVPTNLNAHATPTFTVFVQVTGAVPFDPATNRIFVRFTDGSNVTRGSTSVAVKTP